MISFPFVTASSRKFYLLNFFYLVKMYNSVINYNKCKGVYLINFICTYVLCKLLKYVCTIISQKILYFYDQLMLFRLHLIRKIDILIHTSYFFKQFEKLQTCHYKLDRENGKLSFVSYFLFRHVLFCIKKFELEYLSNIMKSEFSKHSENILISQM